MSRCFLLDTAENISTASQETGVVSCAVVYTPLGSEQDFQGLLPDGFLLIPQRGESLGDRLHHAVEDLFSAGFGSVCLIGSDSPTLPPSYLQQMVEYLRSANEGVVVGPTVDGGYYAIGLKAPWRRLFDDINWSTSRVLEQTKARIAELAPPQMTLPVWYDVDDAIALERLVGDLCQGGHSRRSSSGYLAIHAQRLLNRILHGEAEFEHFRFAFKSDRLPDVHEPAS